MKAKKKQFIIQNIFFMNFLSTDPLKIKRAIKECIPRNPKYKLMTNDAIDMSSKNYSTCSWMVSKLEAIFTINDES